MSRWMMLATVVACALAAGPTTKPAAATKPAPPPAPARVRDGVVNGGVRFLVPADWQVAERNADGFSVWYRLPGDRAVVSMLVTQQKQGIPVHDVAVRQQMGKALVAMIGDDLKKNNLDVIDAPKLENDDRFMCKIHERYKDHGAVVDAVHMYRGIGLNLVSVRAALKSDEKDEPAAKAIHEAGALMLMSVTVGPADPKIVRPVKKADE